MATIVIRFDVIERELQRESAALARTARDNANLDAFAEIYISDKDLALLRQRIVTAASSAEAVLREFVACNMTDGEIRFDISRAGDWESIRAELIEFIVSGVMEEWCADNYTAGIQRYQGRTAAAAAAMKAKIYTKHPL